MNLYNVLITYSGEGAFKFYIAGIGEGVGSMAYNIVNPIRKSIDNISQFKNPLLLT